MQLIQWKMTSDRDKLLHPTRMLRIGKVFKLWKSGDDVFYDLTLKGAKEINEFVETSPSSYYFSISTDNSKRKKDGTYRHRHLHARPEPRHRHRRVVESLGRRLLHELRAAPLRRGLGGLQRLQRRPEEGHLECHAGLPGRPHGRRRPVSAGIPVPPEVQKKIPEVYRPASGPEIKPAID